MEKLAWRNPSFTQHGRPKGWKCLKLSAQTQEHSPSPGTAWPKAWPTPAQSRRGVAQPKTQPSPKPKAHSPAKAQPSPAWPVLAGPERTGRQPSTICSMRGPGNGRWSAANPSISTGVSRTSLLLAIDVAQWRLATLSFLWLHHPTPWKPSWAWASLELTDAWGLKAAGGEMRDEG